MKWLKLVSFIANMLLVSILAVGCHGTDIKSNSNNTNTTSKVKQDYSALYTDVIEDYEKIIEYRLSLDFNSSYMPDLSKQWADYAFVIDNQVMVETDAKYRWNCMIIGMTNYIDAPTKESFGYIFADLNGDNIPELIWVSADYRILCIFTIVDNQVRLVDSFWSSYRCVIMDTGELYTLRIGGAKSSIFAITRIDAQSGKLKTRIEFGEDFGTYFKIENGDGYILTEDEYLQLCNIYPFVTGDKWKENISQGTVFLGQSGDGSVIDKRD